MSDELESALLSCVTAPELLERMRLIAGQPMTAAEKREQILSWAVGQTGCTREFAEEVLGLRLSRYVNEPTIHPTLYGDSAAAEREAFLAWWRRDRDESWQRTLTRSEQWRPTPAQWGANYFDHAWRAWAARAGARIP